MAQTPAPACLTKKCRSSGGAPASGTPAHSTNTCTICFALNLKKHQSTVSSLFFQLMSTVYACLSVREIGKKCKERKGETHLVHLAAVRKNSPTFFVSERRVLCMLKRIPQGRSISFSTLMFSC